MRPQAASGWASSRRRHAAHAVSRRQGGAGPALLALATHCADRGPPDAHAGTPCRRHPAGAVGTQHDAAGCGAAGGGRLRARRVVPALRRRRAGAAARRRRSGPRRQRRTACRGGWLHHRVLGHRPGDRLVGAHGRRVRGRGAQRRDGADRDDRIALPGRRAALVRCLQARHRCRDRSGGIPAREDARDAPAPREVRRHAVRAGAQLQRKPRRPARPAGGDLGGARRRPRAQLGRVAGQGPHHQLRGAAAAAP